MRPLALLLLLAAVAAGCDRPLVDPLEVSVQVVSPDLERALASPTLALELRTLRGTPGATLRIAGATASFDAARGVYRDTLRLETGLNVLPVEILDGDRVTMRDTLYALYLDVRPTAVIDLPPVPVRAGASSTVVPGVGTLIAGGVGESGPLATGTVVAPSGVATTNPLATARAGHVATLLPSGETLLLGGATVLDPTMPSQFVETVEVVSRTGTSLGVVPVEGGAFLRAGATARVLVSSTGRTVVYVYGGRDASTGAVATTGTVAVLEWTADRRLVRLTPPTGAGGFASAEFHQQLSLPDDGGAPRAVVLDGAPPDGQAFEFRWREPGTNYPFDVLRRDVPGGLLTPRRAATAVDLGDGLVLVAGGRTPGGEVTNAVEIYATRAGRAFRLPTSAMLSSPREHASAAILSGRRMVVLGGLGRDGLPAGPPESFLF